MVKHGQMSWLAKPCAINLKENIWKLNYIASRKCAFYMETGTQ